MFQYIKTHYIEELSPSESITIVDGTEGFLNQSTENNIFGTYRGILFLFQFNVKHKSCIVKVIFEMENKQPNWAIWVIWVKS